MVKKSKPKTGMISINQTVADNRRAKFEYEIVETIEAGLILTGTEVKSLRLGQCSINEAYAGPGKADGMEGLYLFNAHIAEYQQAGHHLQHEPGRPRKLLLKKREMDRLLGTLAKEGLTLIPKRIYFNGKGIAKLEIILGKGKKTIDKRETIKQRDWNRQKKRILKGEI